MAISHLSGAQNEETHAVLLFRAVKLMTLSALHLVAVVFYAEPNLGVRIKT